MIKQGIRSTQTPPPKDPDNMGHSKRHKVSMHAIPTDTLKYTIATDLPGWHPVTSARGHKNIFLMVDYDSNYIHAVPIKSRKAVDLISGFEICYATLTSNGLTAEYVRLDNEMSNLLLTHIEDEALTYQLASPGDHYVN